MGKKRMQSPSSMNTYFQCPRKYFFIYKLRMPTSPSIHLVRGSAAHSALESLFTLLPEVISENYHENLKVIVTELLKKYWSESKEKFDELNMSDQELDSYFEETKMMVVNHVNVLAKRIEAQMEKGLSFPDAFRKITPLTEKEYLSWDYYVKGFIDVIENPDGAVRLMDYKTSKRAHMTPQYKLQLAIYALLYELKHKVRPEEVGIYFIKHTDPQAEQTLKVDDELISHAKFKIEQIHASTESDNLVDYPKNETPLCKWSTGQCDFYDYCFGNKKIPKEPLPSTWKKKK